MKYLEVSLISLAWTEWYTDNDTFIEPIMNPIAFTGKISNTKHIVYT